MKLCHACKKQISLTVKIARLDDCPFCHADLHCCLNCTFYAKTASKQCREPIAEPIKDKSKANYCDYFTFAENNNNTAPVDAATEKARAALNDLFKR